MTNDSGRFVYRLLVRNKRRSNFSTSIVENKIYVAKKNGDESDALKRRVKYWQDIKPAHYYAEPWTIKVTKYQLVPGSRKLHEPIETPKKPKPKPYRRVIIRDAAGKTRYIHGDQAEVTIEKLQQNLEKAE